MSEVDKRKLSTYVERLERLKDEAKGTADAMKEVLAEAKSDGLEPKYIRRLVKERGEDQEKRRLEEAEYEVYRAAMGMD